MAKAKRTGMSKTRTKKTTQTSADKINEEIDSLFMEDGEMSIPPQRLIDYCFLVYGESAIGKTSTIAEFPGSYVLQLDPKRSGLAIRQSLIPNLTISQLKKQKPVATPWQLIEGMITKLLEDDSIEIIFIDNFSLFYEHALRHVCYKQMINDPNEVNDDYGATWRKIADMMTNALNMILYSDKGLGLVCHAVEKEISLGTKTIDRIQPDLMKAAFKWVKENTDFAFYMMMGSDDRRYIRLRNDFKIWTKCVVDVNHRKFDYSDGTEMDKIPCGRSPGETYKGLMTAWDNKFVNPKTAKKKMSRKKG